MSPSKLGYETVEGEQNNNYVFSSGGYAASGRLNLQYYLFEWQTGYQVSPLIPLDGENLRIADVGTGSGIWLVDLSSKVPASATLDAFDVTTDLFPHSTWLPSNVKFHRLDVFEPVPAEFVGKYDLVHIRFFAPVLRNQGPDAVIKNVMQLLKPGGYLQWDERALMMGFPSIGPGVTKAMEDLKQTMLETFKAHGTEVGWIDNLDKSFNSCGLVGVKNERYPIHKAMTGYLTDFLFQTLEEASYGADRMLGASVGDNLRAKLMAAYEEHRIHGSAMEADMVVCVGRKAE